VTKVSESTEEQFREYCKSKVGELATNKDFAKIVAEVYKEAMTKEQSISTALPSVRLRLQRSMGSLGVIILGAKDSRDGKGAKAPTRFLVVRPMATGQAQVLEVSNFGPELEMEDGRLVKIPFPAKVEIKVEQDDYGYHFTSIGKSVQIGGQAALINQLTKFNALTPLNIIPALDANSAVVFKTKIDSVWPIRKYKPKEESEETKKEVETEQYNILEPDSKETPEVHPVMSIGAKEGKTKFYINMSARKNVSGLWWIDDLISLAGEAVLAGEASRGKLGADGPSVQEVQARYLSTYLHDREIIVAGSMGTPTIKNGITSVSIFASAIIQVPEDITPIQQVIQHATDIVDTAPIEPVVKTEEKKPEPPLPSPNTATEPTEDKPPKESPKSKKGTVITFEPTDENIIQNIKANMTLKTLQVFQGQRKVKDTKFEEFRDKLLVNEAKANNWTEEQMKAAYDAKVEEDTKDKAKS
jgi:hypothetical protein